VVTVGSQEGLDLTLRALRRDAGDVVVTVRPCYTGLGGAAELVDMPPLPVADSPEGINLGGSGQNRRRGQGRRAAATRVLRGPGLRRKEPRPDRARGSTAARRKTRFPCAGRQSGPHRFSRRPRRLRRRGPTSRRRDRAVRRPAGEDQEHVDGQHLVRGIAASTPCVPSTTRIVRRLTRIGGSSASDSASGRTCFSSSPDNLGESDFPSAPSGTISVERWSITCPVSVTNRPLIRKTPSWRSRRISAPRRNSAGIRIRISKLRVFPGNAPVQPQ